MDNINDSGSKNIRGRFVIQEIIEPKETDEEISISDMPSAFVGLLQGRWRNDPTDKDGAHLYVCGEYAVVRLRERPRGDPQRVAGTD